MISKIVRIITYGPGKLFDITNHLEEVASKMNNGVLVIFSKGSTGALVRLPRSRDAIELFERELWKLVPIYGWDHPGNAYAHLRSTLLGTWMLIPVNRSRPLLNNLGVYFLENQPVNARRREVFIYGKVSK